MKTKRILSMFLLLLLVLVPLVVAHADPPDDQCPSPYSSDGHHTWNLRGGTDPTCTEPGSLTWVCADCSQTYTEPIPALGHTWDNGVVTQAPTCAAEGVRTFTCLRCGATRTEAIAKTADHTPVSVPGKAATCTEAGLTDGSKCSVCGAVLTAQQSIPAKGHSPVAVPGRAATCTEAGLTDGSKCSVCGAVLTAQQSIPALGHAWDGGAVTVAPTCVDKGYRTNTCTRCGATELTGIPPTGEHAWDEGKITAEPTGLTPGVKTFTCTVCGATKTEAVDATLSVFSGMNIPSGFGFLRTGDPISDILRIVTQPQGSFVPQGGYTELTVEAAGGEGAYTYEWWYAPALPTVGTSALTDFLTGFYGDSVATVSQAKEKTSPIAAEFLEAWKKQNGISGTVDHSVTATEGTIASAETETMTMEIFNPLAKKIDDKEFCWAWIAGTYWCVVYDEAGHHVTSDKVQMKDGLYIAVQPESKNLYGLSSVDLTCRAGGGSGNYAYTWYDGNGNVVEDQQTYVAEQMGVYYCEVADYDTLEVVQSKPAQVYSEERDLRPIITLQPETVTLDYREDGIYSVTFSCEAVSAVTGDDSTLDYEWETYDNTKGWVYAGITYPKLPYSAVQPGTICRCKVIDKTSGQFTISNEAKVQVKCSCKITGNKLVDIYHHTDLYCEIEGGAAPYNVELYQVRIIGMKLNTETNAYDYNKVRIKYDSLTVNKDGSFTFIGVPCHYEYVAIMDTDWTNGEPILQSGWMEYVLVVTDNNGIESESVIYRTK